MNIVKNGRFWLSGPAAFLLAIFIILGTATWFPKGAAQINNIVLPMIFFPLIWAALFFYAYLARSVTRAGFIFAGLAVLHVALVSGQFLNGA